MRPSDPPGVGSAVCPHATDLVHRATCSTVRRPCAPARSAPDVEGTEIQQYPCSSTSLAQRLVIYRDVPGSHAVGIRSAAIGAMLASPTPESGKEWLQFRAGLADGTGTVLLTPL